MKTKLYILITSSVLMISISSQSQSNVIYDGVDITPLKFDDPLPQQSARKVYDIYQNKQHLLPSVQGLIAMKRNTNLPSNMEEIYFENNWLEVEHHWFNDPDTEPFQSFNFGTVLVPDRKRGTLKLQYRHVINPGRPNPELVGMDTFDGVHENFETHSNYTYRHSYDPTDIPPDSYSVIVDYRDGMLVLENTFTGKIGDFTSKRRYRVVYLAIPKAIFSNQNFYIDSSIDSDEDDEITPSISYQESVPFIQTTQSSRPVSKNSQAIANAYFNQSDAMPTAQNLKSLRPGQSIPDDLFSDLFNYDWLELGRFEWYNGETYTANHHRMDIVSFDRSAPSRRYSATLSREHKTATVQYLDQWIDEPVKLSKKGNFTYIVTNSEILSSVISYSNRTLILDQKDPITGAVYRLVYLAVEKE
jgi:hypothetical protein